MWQIIKYTMSQPFSALHCKEQTNMAEAKEAQIKSKNVFLLHRY